MNTKTLTTPALAGIVCIALTLSACGGASADADQNTASEIPAVTITTVDHAFSAPEQIDAGLVSITMQNDGNEPHHVQFVRLNDDVTLEQLGAALQEGPEAAFPLVSFAGGPSMVDGGGSQTVTVNLTAGTHMLLCLVPDSDGVPHLAHGMAAPIEVVDNGQDNPEPLTADLTIQLLDFAYAFSSGIEAGPQIWEVENDGDVIHEIALIKLNDGATMDDVEAYMHAPEGPPPFANVGGLQAIDPGTSGWVHLDLAPGDYVAVCHIPDPASGKTHIELGMVMPFTVN